MAVLFGVQFAVNQIWPPVPKKARPVIAPTNTVAQATNVVAAIQPPPPVERGVEHTLAISNDVVRVEFTSWGGAIKSVELFKYHTTLRGPALLVNGSSNDVFTLEQRDARTVVLRSAGITKTVTLSNDYVMQVGLTLADNAPVAFVSTGTATPADPKEGPQYLIADWQGGPKWNERHLSRVTNRTHDNKNREMIPGRWVGVKSQYFAQILTAPTNAVSITYRPVGLPAWTQDPKSAHTNGVTANIEVPVQAGTCSLVFYAGPKEYSRLLALGQNQEEAMDYGSWMDCYSGIFGLILYRSLGFFYGLIPSWGVAILLVTLALKIIFWPIQAKSIESMKQMQKFQPHVTKLREKFKDDPQRLNAETMKLYKEHKINPFAGCLPMFVQLPVLIAFYKVLSCDIAMRGVPFLWIHDLSLPDTVYTLAGIAINPLPLIMTGSMILQQKLTPQTGDPQQAKMMMFMPLIMLMFFYNTAAGLTLYWTLQQLLSMGQQWWGMRQEKLAAANPK